MASPRPASEPAPSELNTSCSLAFLEVGKDKLTVRYNGPAQHDNDVGCIQSNHPVPHRRLLYYFEVAVKEASGGSITLGFSGADLKQGRHPGHEPNSFGYRSDTGRKYHSSLPARGEEYGPSYGPGDVVGAGIHLTKHEIFFTKNGQHLGTAFRHVTTHPLFPTIGLHSQGALAEVNFGRQPFQFDLAAMEARERRQQAEALDSTPVCAGDVHQLVRNYLLHYGYADSLVAFDAAAGMAAAEADAAALALPPAVAATSAPAPAPDAQQAQQADQGQGQGGSAVAGGGAGAGAAAAAPGSTATGTAGAPSSAGGTDRDAVALALLPLRSQLRQHLMAGDTAAAHQLLQEHAPHLLTAAVPTAGDHSGNSGGSGGSGGGSSSGGFELQFHLACQQYIELIRRGDIGGALSYAEGTLSALRGASPEHDAVLRDVVALIAYQQPEQSPLAPLLSAAQREATADVINSALLRSRAPPGSSEPQAALETLLQQLVAVQHELHELAGGHGPEFDLQEHLPQPQPPQQGQEGQEDGGTEAGQQQQHQGRQRRRRRDEQHPQGQEEEEEEEEGAAASGEPMAE